VLTYLYNISPFFIQNIFVTIYGYYWKARRFGGVFRKEYIGYQLREKYSHKQWCDYTAVMLQKIIAHAKETVPYYQKSLGDIDIQSISIDTLHQLPILTKQDLRQYGQNELMSDIRESGTDFYSSSGSTGTPVKINYSYRTHQRYSAAFEARIRNWAGISYKSRRGMIGGRRVVSDGVTSGPFYRYNYAEKQVYFSAYHISPVNIHDYVEAMHKYQLEYMTGYAVSNYLLAKMIKSLGLRPPQMKAVITSSEKLNPEMRSLLEEVYRCKVYDSYSGVECCGLISECEHGRLHISPDVGFIEIIKQDGSHAKPGETGKAICTGFLNFNQPLIRYDIGDEITLSEEQVCPCNRKMPIVKEIVGRSEDIITGPDGRQMVRFHGIFIDLPNVIEGQVIQHSTSRYTVNISTVTGLTDVEKNTIIKRMCSQLGEVNIHIVELDNIPRSANGKFKAVISEMNEN
jgi:phenylacetate-CoA ligase